MIMVVVVCVVLHVGADEERESSVVMMTLMIMVVVVCVVLHVGADEERAVIMVLASRVSGCLFGHPNP